MPSKSSWRVTCLRPNLRTMFVSRRGARSYKPHIRSKRLLDALMGQKGGRTSAWWKLFTPIKLELAAADKEICALQTLTSTVHCKEAGVKAQTTARMTIVSRSQHELEVTMDEVKVTRTCPQESISSVADHTRKRCLLSKHCACVFFVSCHGNVIVHVYTNGLTRYQHVVLQHHVSRHAACRFASC
jgi:hypothetical protein